MPALNKYIKYPIGHPEVVVIDKDVKWEQPCDNPYKGILKVETDYLN